MREILYGLIEWRQVQQSYNSRCSVKIVSRVRAAFSVGCRLARTTALRVAAPLALLIDRVQPAAVPAPWSVASVVSVLNRHGQRVKVSDDVTGRPVPVCVHIVLQASDMNACLLIDDSLECII